MLSLERMEEEAFGKIQHPFVIKKKKPSKLEIELELPKPNGKHLQKFYSKYYS